MTSTSRRRFLQLLAGLTSARLVQPVPGLASSSNIITRVIPSSGVTIPTIGMGTWLTFDVENDVDELATRVRILQTFFDMGGSMIDSSPMYGSSEETIGYCLKNIKNKQNLFSATKVWTHGRRSGISEMESSLDLWNLNKFDLMQVHNMLDWETHLETLKAWKAKGRIGHIGITTSHGRRHRRFEKVLETQPFDFVQFTYNILDRDAEQRLLPLAAEKGMAVIINRPFQGGDLFDLVVGKPLPAWVNEFDCRNWAQFFLKFVISHPHVTCTIPATSRVDHMEENMGALYGRLPTPEMRKKMIRHFSRL